MLIGWFGDVRRDFYASAVHWLVLCFVGGAWFEPESRRRQKCQVSCSDSLYDAGGCQQFITRGEALFVGGLCTHGAAFRLISARVFLLTLSKCQVPLLSWQRERTAVRPSPRRGSNRPGGRADRARGRGAPAAGYSLS